MSCGFRAEPEKINPNELSFDYREFAQIICNSFNTNRNIHTHPEEYSVNQITEKYVLFFKDNLPFDRLRYFSWDGLDGFEIIRKSVVIKNILCDLSNF